MNNELKDVTKGMIVAAEMPVNNGVLFPYSVFVKLPIENVTEEHLTISGKPYPRVKILAYDIKTNSHIFRVSEKPECITPSQYEALINAPSCTRLLDELRNDDKRAYGRVHELIQLLSLEFGKKR